MPRAARPSFTIIGLTGSIGMGKSTVAGLLRDRGFPIYNADQAVHNVLKKNGSAVAAVGALFPATLKRGAIDRALLGQEVFGKPRKLRQLERLIHPLIRQAESDFVTKARKGKKRAVILEIPLLFETGADRRCDVTLCVTAPAAVQKARVLARPNMTEEKLRAILARQMPNAHKRRKADYVIPTGVSIDDTDKHLLRILRKLSLVD